MVTEKYFVDANILIAAYRSYYAFDIAPSFWEQLKDILQLDSVIVLCVVRDELLAGGDSLTAWLKEVPGIHYLNHKREDIVVQYAKVLQSVATSPLYKEEALNGWAIENIADPWLIAAASVEKGILVTNEKGNNSLDVHRPSKVAKLPDIAKNFGVRCINTYAFMRKFGIVL